MPSLTIISIIALCCSALCCGLIVATAQHHIKTSGDVGGADHKSHKGTVPRIGGIGIYAGVLLAAYLASINNPIFSQALPIALCFLPAFITGLTEDLTNKVQPVFRYIGTLLSALLLCIITGVNISRVDVWGVDQLLAFPLPAALFFAFAFSSMSHAFNLIDGHNGLCGGVSVITGIAIAIPAAIHDAAIPLLLATTLATANLGFLVFNFPRASLFMGDNGAYINGGVLAFSAVALIQAVPTLSPWFAFLVFAYPTSETLYSMYRRKQKSQDFMQPDKLHLHSLIAQRYNHTSPIVWAYCGSICCAALLLRHNPGALMMTSALAMVAYWLSYNRLGGAYSKEL